MYAAHYNLKEMPFEDGFDPKFIWFGKKYLDILADFKAVIHERNGIYVLTGDAGTGKTFLVKRFLNEFRPNKIVATIPYPGLEVHSFFNYLSEAFQLKLNSNDRGLFWLHVSRFLLDTYKMNMKVILVIDEAQGLSHELHREIMLLSNIRSGTCNLMNVIFAGQPSFRDMLLQQGNSRFHSQSPAMYYLEPLSEDETKALILHRLKAAGAESHIFSTNAFHEIYRLSCGYPRLIITVCDRALLNGFVKNIRFLDKDIIIETADELTIKGDSRNEKELIAIKDNHRFHDMEAKSPYENKTETSQSIKRHASIGRTSKLQKSLIMGVLAAIVFSFGIFKLGFLPEMKNEPMQTEGPQEATSDYQTKNVTPTQEDGVEKTRPIHADESQKTVIQENSPVEKSGEQEYSVSIGADQVVIASKKPDSVSADEVKRKNGLGSDNAKEITKARSLQSKSVSEKVSASAGELNQAGAAIENNDTISGALSSSLHAPELPLLLPRKKSGLESTGLTSSSMTSQELLSDTARLDGRAVQAKGPKPEEVSNGRGSPAILPPAAWGIPQQIYVSEPELESSAVERVTALSNIARLEPEIENKSIESRITKEERLKSFLDDYCETYASKNIEKFITFFNADAEENGKSFSSLLANYRREFSANDAISYRIELQHHVIDTEHETVKIEGKFFLQWLPRGSILQKSSGKIFMELKENGGSFRIYRLDYLADQ